MKKRIFSLIALLLTLSFCFNAAPEVADAADDAVGVSWIEGSVRKYTTYTLNDFKGLLNNGISAASGSPYVSVCLLKDIETEKFVIPNYHGSYQIDLDTHTWTVTGADSITAAAVNIIGGPTYGSKNTGKGTLRFTNGNMGTLFTIKGAETTNDSGVWIENAIIEFGNGAKCTNFFRIEEIVSTNDSTAIHAENSAFLNIKSTADAGGVFYIDYDDTCLNKIEFTNCVFSDCSSGYYGGAIYIADIPGTENSHTLLDLSGSSFNYCSTGYYGGAIYINPYYLDINTDSAKDTMFFKCSAGNSGGAIFDDAGYGTFKHMFFSNNSANSTSNGGGAMFICDTSAAGYRTIDHCVFFKNSTKGYGGALYDDAPYYDTLRNCRFEFNSAAKGGNEICYPARTIENCEFYRQSINTSDNSDFYDGYKPTGNFFDRDSSSSYAESLSSQEGSEWMHYKVTNADDFRKLAILVEWDRVYNGGYRADVHNDISDVYYQTYEINGVDGRNHTITSMHMESAFADADRLTQKNVLGRVTMKNSEASGFTLSSGNWWIIGGASAVAIAAVATIIVVTKKKKKAA